MRIVIVGAGGRLGQKLGEVIGRETDWTIIPVTRAGILVEDGIIPVDPLSRTSWRERLQDDRIEPDVIINAAAITNVDRCETSREEAWWTNVTLTELLLEAARRTDARFIQISTDHVFDGTAGPYPETAAPSPINYYGKTKHAAENACLQSQLPTTIVRTMWLFGSTIGNKPNYVDWILQNVSQRKPINVATDEIGNPTLTDDVAYGILRAIETRRQGVLHMASHSRMSRWELAGMVAKEWGFSPDVIHPVLSEQLPRAARRPLESGLLSLTTETQLGMRFTNIENALKTYRIQMKRQLV